MNKKQHEKWLRRFKASRSQIREAKKTLGTPNSLSSYVESMKVSNRINTSDKIPENGVKDPDISKIKFTKENYALLPAYNKGPVMVLSKDNIKYAGKK